MGKTIVAPPRPQWELRRGSVTYRGTIYSFPERLPAMEHSEALALEAQGLISRVGERSAGAPISGAEMLLLRRGAPASAGLYLEAADLGVIFRIRAFDPSRAMRQEILRLAIAFPRSAILIEALKLAADEPVRAADREMAAAVGLI